MARTFMDMDTWKGSGNKFGLDYKQIVLMHLNRCVINTAVEWKGGYWQTVSQTKEGISTSEKRYISDTREVFSNGVEGLRITLMAYFDDKMRVANKNFKKELEEFEKKEVKTKEQTNKFKREKVNLYLKLLANLIRLLKRKNFFEYHGTTSTL